LKIAFCNVLGSGHVNPTLPLVDALTGRGDEVTYYSYPARRAVIEQVGARYRNYGSDDFRVAQYHPQGTFPTQLLPATVAVLPYLIDELTRLDPDLIVTDSMAPWGLAAGRVLNKRVLGSVPTFALSRKHVALMMQQFDVARDAVVLGAIQKLRENWDLRFDVADVGFHASDVNVVYTSRAFNPPLDDRTERFEFIGPMLGRKGARGDFPLSLFEAGGRKRLYISMGTVVGDMMKLGQEFFQSFFAAFGDRADYLVALSVGAETDPDSLEAPSNFIVRRTVPQLDLLQHVDAFLTHGGMNSMCEAMAHGVPVVCLPFFGDQFLTAEQARSLGAGLVLDPKQLDPSALLSAVERVTGEPSFRQAAAALQTGMQQTGGVPRALQVIDELAH